MGTGTGFSVAAEHGGTLRGWLRSSKTDRSLAERARIVLLSSEGVSATEIQKRLDVTRPTVFKWRKRYRELGVDGLQDAPRSGRPTELTEATLSQATLLGRTEHSSAPADPGLRIRS